MIGAEERRRNKSKDIRIKRLANFEVIGRKIEARSQGVEKKMSLNINSQ